jgi:hypothetical protein
LVQPGSDFDHVEHHQVEFPAIIPFVDPGRASSNPRQAERAK